MKLSLLRATSKVCKLHTPLCFLRGITESRLHVPHYGSKVQLQLQLQLHTGTGSDAFTPLRRLCLPFMNWRIAECRMPKRSTNSAASVAVAVAVTQGEYLYSSNNNNKKRQLQFCLFVYCINYHLSQVDNFVCQRTCEARSEAQSQRQSQCEREREREGVQGRRNLAADRAGCNALKTC